MKICDVKNKRGGGELWLVLRLPVWTTFGFSWINVSVTLSQSCWMDPEARAPLQRMLAGKQRLCLWLFILACTLSLTQPGLIVSWEQLWVYTTGVPPASRKRRRWWRRTLECSWAGPDFHWLSGDQTCRSWRKPLKTGFVVCFMQLLTRSCVSCPPGFIKQWKCSYR